MKFLLSATTLFEGVDTTSLGGVEQLGKNAIQLFSFAVGALAVIFIIIGGIQYISSAGNPEGVSKAKKTIFYAIGGVILALSINVIIAVLNGVFGL